MENNEGKTYKVYGMLIEIKDTFFLSVQYARSLEEAFNQAKLEFLRLNPELKNNDLTFGAKIGLFTLKNVKQLTDEHRISSEKKLQKIAAKHREQEKKEEQEIVKKEVPKEVKLDPIDIKNMIMKEIITKKDKEMFKKNKSLFNENDNKYIKEHLKKKVK